jgi:hypothetical protein
MLKGASDMSAAVWDEPGEACDECARLAEQEHDAYLSGDGSRQTDLRVMRRRHRAAEHGAPMPGFMPSLLAGPFTPEAFARP